MACGCGCGCSKAEIGIVCDKVPECLKFLKLFVGLQYAGQTVTVILNRKRGNGEVCKKTDLLVDALGFVQIDVKLNLGYGFLLRASFMRYNYKVFVQTQAKQRIKLTYKGVEYCSLSFQVGSCDEETLTLNP